MSFQELNLKQKKELVSAIIVDGVSYEDAHYRFGVAPSDIYSVIQERAILPYNIEYPQTNKEQEALHKETVYSWLKGLAGLVFASFLLIVSIQIFLGGFTFENVSTTLAYITNPISKILNTALAAFVIVAILSFFFPILSTFINDRVNTIYLKVQFLKAKPESQLNFLAMVLLALSILVGLVFSAKGQTLPRDCVMKVAMSEVGVVEVGGNNRGARIDYYRSVSLGRKVSGYNDPWCGYFVSYTYKTCGIKTDVRYPEGAKNWFKHPGRIVYRANFKNGIFAKKPQKGDLVGYLMRGSRDINHIEILSDWNIDDGYYNIVSGNTSKRGVISRDSNDQDGVWAKRRNIASAYVVHNLID